MQRTAGTRVEQHVMHMLLIVLGLYAFWTIAHQVATFVGISWDILTQAVAWLLVPVITLTYWQAGHLAKPYAHHLPERMVALSGLKTRYVWLFCLGFLGLSTLLVGYTARYALVMVCITATMLIAWRKTPASEVITARNHLSGRLSAWITPLYLFGLVSLAVLLVLSANRADFDDAEYIQLALQTLLHPERAPHTFDASLGIVLDQFRFAPYRITAYETFIALMTQWTGLNILDVYYLLLPATSAGLSILVAFVFTRWFLPLRWSLLAMGLYLLISSAWGETHIAYGNRMFVRLFQGKGLLVTITTPLTVITALLWMRKPCAKAWLGLLIMQVVAVGVSSSGLVITLFATVLALLAGLLAQPSYNGLLAASLGCVTIAYPVGLGVWLKYLSNASGKVEEIGTYLPINASLGGSWREALALAIMITAFLLTTGVSGRLIQVRGCSRSETAAKTYSWLVFTCFVLVFNPFLTEYLTEITSKNMNWRLAWAAPVPLLLAVGLVYLLHWGQGKYEGAWQKTARLLPLGLIVAFATVNPWTLAKTNQVYWGFLGHKLPPEYQRAVELARDIRQQTTEQQEITVLVEPRVGTWLTVVAPDFKLIMPGHGYPLTLKTIMDNHDFDGRYRLLSNIDVIASGDESLDKLLDAYGVNVIAIKTPTQFGNDWYRVQMRVVEGGLKHIGHP